VSEIRPGQQRAAVLEQYATPDNLSARARLYARQEPRYDLPGIVVELLAGVAGPVVDVGCGPGHYRDRLRSAGLTAIGVDLSPGMAADLVADAVHLPIRDACAGATLALHMLYHLPDPTAGLRELRRATRRGGRIVVLTNAPEHLTELRELSRAAAGRDEFIARSFDNLHGGHRALVESVLGPVDERTIVGAIHLSDGGPLLEYAASCREFYEPHLEVSWAVFLDRFASLVASRLPITIHTASTFWIARA
jgi:SAM-dependent methyltransferase